jgi:hypothetical protein
VLLIALAAVIVVSALIWLTLALVRTWKLVRKVGRDIGAAGDRLAGASAGLQTASQRAAGPPSNPDAAGGDFWE